MKCYMEICYTYVARDGRPSFFPTLAIVEVDAYEGELIEILADRALDKIKKKYPDKDVYMIDYRYLGPNLEIIR